MTSNSRIAIPTPNGIRVSIRNDRLGDEAPMPQLVMNAISPDAPREATLFRPLVGVIGREYYLGKKGYVFDLFTKGGILIRRDVREDEIKRSDSEVALKAGF